MVMFAYFIFIQFLCIILIQSVLMYRWMIWNLFLLSGVDDSNREVIDWCLETTDVEKKIRRAARNMFQVINGTHQEVLSRAEYIESVKKLAGGDKLEEKLLLAAGKRGLWISCYISSCCFCLFWVYRPTQEFFTLMETSPLPVKGCKFWPMLDTHGHWSVRVLKCATPTVTQFIRL